MSFINFVWLKLIKMQPYRRQCSEHVKGKRTVSEAGAVVHSSFLKKDLYCYLPEDQVPIAFLITEI